MIMGQSWNAPTIQGSTDQFAVIFMLKSMENQLPYEIIGVKPLYLNLVRPQIFVL